MSTKRFAELRGEITPARRARLDSLRNDALAEIEEYERPIREGVAWPVPPYRAVLIESDDEIEIESGRTTRVWAVTVPDVPGVATQGRTITEAIAMAREAICHVLNTADWGFELTVETYPAANNAPYLDA